MRHSFVSVVHEYSVGVDIVLEQRPEPNLRVNNFSNDKKRIRVRKGPYR